MAEQQTEVPKKQNKSEHNVSFYKLFSFADRKDVILMAVGTVAAIANGLAQPLMTVIIGQAINSFASTPRSHVVAVVSEVAFKFLYLAAYSCVATFLAVSCWMVTGERQAARIRGLYLKTILQQDIAFFDSETSTGEVIGRMAGDTVLIQDAMGEKVGRFIQFMSTFLGGFAVAFAKGWELALLLCASIPLLVGCTGITASIITKMSSRGQLAYAEAGNIVDQIVGAIRTVASFTGEKKAIEKYESKLQIAYRAAVKQALGSGLGMGAVLLVVYGTYALAVWFGSKMIIHHGYSGGQVINIVTAFMAGGLSLGQTSPCINAFAAGKAAAYKMFETIKRKPKIDAYDRNGVVLEDICGDIDLKDVYFQYPARPDVQIFDGLTLHIARGTTAALVGQSGSGKSTVIALLERFYDPNAGAVLIDEIDLKKMQLKWIREKIGLVSQEPNLFTTTIKENIAYGKENATDAEIRSAIELANAAKFIDRLPQGLDTMVGEHGTQLSGGQKQRIAIARAILKNPKILLLDEATSALDAESEHIVQEALESVMLNRTTVVVAHRLTTVRNADMIAVLHQGKLVEQGTHDELIKDPEGAYSQLVKLQRGAKDSEEVVGTARKAERPDDVEAATTSRSQSCSLSWKRSMSTGSSGSRQSFKLTAGVPGHINIHETNEMDDDSSTRGGVSEKRNISVSIKRLAYLNRPEIQVLLVGSFAAGVAGLFPPLFGFFFSSAIKSFFEPPHMLSQDSKKWALLYAGMGLVSLVIAPIQYYFFGIAGGRLVKRIRSLTFEKVVHEEISWFDDPANSSGAIGARLSTDASTVKTLVGDSLSLVVQNMSTIVAAFAIAFSANWRLTVVVLVALPFMMLQAIAQRKFAKGFSSDAKAMYEEASQVASDAVGSIRTIASFCAEEKVMGMYEEKCEAPLKHGIRLGVVSGSGFGFTFLALYCAMAFCFYIGAVLVRDGKATFGEVFKVFYALTISAMSISQSLSSLAADLNKATDSSASIFGILDRKPKIDTSGNEGITLPTIAGNIDLEHVSFKYPTRPNLQIFRDLCLSIPSGKMVALVGESGSGKSTVISLIERFYDPDAGQVYLDGTDIKRLKLSWLRHQIGLVSQEPTLFNETIRSNIAYGKEGDVTEEEIIAATTASNAHNFISALPQGYETSVGDRGVQLSGGQKQRIAIARAILKDPKILLLDEATSALDAESERVVQEALEKVTVNRTSVVIAHRLSTIKNADIIAVVRNGVIAEKGRHDELMKILHGAYASLVALHMSST